MKLRTSAGNIFLGLLALTTFRDFIEMVLEGNSVMRTDDPMATLKNYFLHFNTFFYLIYVCLSLILYGFSLKRVSISECFRVGALAMMLILLPPVFGYIFEEPSLILYPSDPMGVVCNLHHLADPSFLYKGLTRGMRLEILLAGAGAVVYLYIKTRRIFVSLIAGICISFTCIAIGLSIPFLAQVYEYGLHFGDHPLHQSTLLHQGFVVHGTGCKIGLLYIFLSLLFFSLAYYLRNPGYFCAAIRNFRWTRSLHYMLLYVAGMIYVYFNPPLGGDFSYIRTIWQYPFDVIGILMAGLAVFLSFQSAVIFNDIYDYKIDRLSNANRPFVSHSIPLGEYRLLGRLFAIVALSISLCISETFFFFITLYQLLAFLYSAPPFRLRRYLVASNMLLAVIFMLTFHAGAVTLVSDYRFWLIPTHVTFVLLLLFALSLTVKDAKDYEGDRCAGVHTLYTVFGKKTGDVITSLFVSCSIVLAPVLLHLPSMLVFSSVVCILFLLVITFVHHYRAKEGLVVLLYFLYMVVLFYSLIFKASDVF